MNLDQDNCVSSTVDVVLNERTRRDLLSSWIISPPSSQQAEPQGPSVMRRVKPLLTPATFVLCPCSVILWLGDLNYRIEELDMEKVKKLIEEKDFQTLYAYDQVQMATCAL